jgi:nucleoside-diphosphate-sugar epimerase
LSKYLITGGAGFIGSHLAETLVARGDEVVVLDDLSTGKVENLASFRQKLHFVEGSITDQETLRACCEGISVVFHEAALASVPRSVANPLATNEANVTGTLNVLWAAKEAGASRVVYAASSSVYGDTEILPKHEEMAANPQSPYAVSKHVGELYCQVFADLYGLSTVSLRYFNVFGPRQDPQSQYAAVIPLFITRFLAGRPPEIHGDGAQTRDFTYIANVVAANLAAAAAPDLHGEVINVACGDRISVNELASRVQRLCGAEQPAVHGPPRPGDVKHSQADIGRARRLLGFAPEVDFEHGLARTVSWYREQGR